MSFKRIPRFRIVVVFYIYIIWYLFLKFWNFLFFTYFFSDTSERNFWEFSFFFFRWRCFLISFAQILEFSIFYIYFFWYFKKIVWEFSVFLSIHVFWYPLLKFWNKEYIIFYYKDKSLLTNYILGENKGLNRM